MNIKLLFYLTMAAISPQAGPQTEFFRTRADIAVYGGAAGGGKTWALLAEPLRHIDNPRFGAVFFRRTTPEITNEGGPWDEAMSIYPGFKAVPKIGDRTFIFPTGASVQFSHIEHETDKLKWQGSQIALIEFDELTHFTEGQFFYMLSRNRSTCGVKPYLRASTNPDYDSWVRKFIDPFIGDDGFPNDQCGQLIYFARSGGKIDYAWTKAELVKKYNWLNPDTDIMSLTFIPSSLDDNKILTEKDPSYRGRLLSMSSVEQKRLLLGNWDAKDETGRMFFNPRRGQAPGYIQNIAYLDPAFTSNQNSDFSALCIGGKQGEAYYVKGGYLIKANIDEMYDKVTAILLDQKIDSLVVEQNQAQIALIREFRNRGFYVRGVNNTKNKAVRIQDAVAKNWGNIIFGDVQEAWLNQVLNYTSIPPAAYDDAPDSLAGLIESYNLTVEVTAI